MEIHPDDDEINIINYFDILPKETISVVALNLSPHFIINLCRSNSRFNEIICNDNFFWENKFKKDYGNVSFDVTDWKQLYMNANNVWFGIFQPHPVLQIHGIDAQNDGNNAIIIDTHNDVWVNGSNIGGVLGLGDSNKRINYVKIPNIKAKKISLFERAAIYIDINNDVWVTGSANSWYGFDNFTSINKIPDIKAKDVSVGNSYMAIIDTHNNIWISGENHYGALGLGPDIVSINFMMIPGFKAKKIACGYNKTIFIDMDDDIWIFGNNNDGGLGLGDSAIGYVYVPTKIHAIKGKEIAIWHHTIIIDLEGRMFGFGNNKNNQLGLGENAPNIVNTPIIIDDSITWKDAAVEGSRSLALDMNNNMWVCGGFRYLTYKNFTLNNNFVAFKIFKGGFIGVQIEQSN